MDTPSRQSVQQRREALDKAARKRKAKLDKKKIAEKIRKQEETKQ
jgi:hypothetical protein